MVIVFQEFLFRENALLLSRPRRSKTINKSVFCFEYMPPNIVLIFFADHINKLKIKLHALVQIFKKIIIKTSFYSIFPSKSHVGEWYFLIAQVFFLLSSRRNNCSQTRHFSEQQKTFSASLPGELKALFFPTLGKTIFCLDFLTPNFLFLIFHAAALGAQISTESWTNLALEFTKNSFVFPKNGMFNILAQISDGIWSIFKTVARQRKSPHGKTRIFH